MVVVNLCKELVGQARVEVAASDVAAGLAAVMPHAAPSSAHLPMLEAVYFDTFDGHLYAVATQRYTLGTWRFDAEADREIRFLMSIEDVKRLHKLARESKTYVLTFTFDTDAATVSSPNGSSMTMRAVDGQFPAWRTLLNSTGRKVDRETSSVRTFNPAQLALFAKAAGKHDAMTMWCGPRDVDAAVVQVGERFFGLVMPHRAHVADSVPTFESVPTAVSVVA